MIDIYIDAGDDQIVLSELCKRVDGLEYGQFTVQTSK